MIPKDGGNNYSGALFLGYVPVQFVANNSNAALQVRGFTGLSSVNRL
jgi:hypothetical protein